MCACQIHSRKHWASTVGSSSPSSFPPPPPPHPPPPIPLPHTPLTPPPSSPHPLLSSSSSYSYSSYPILSLLPLILIPSYLCPPFHIHPPHLPSCLISQPYPSSSSLPHPPHLLFDFISTSPILLSSPSSSSSSSSSPILSVLPLLISNTHPFILLSFSTSLPPRLPHLHLPHLPSYLFSLFSHPHPLILSSSPLLHVLSCLFSHLPSSSPPLFLPLIFIFLISHTVCSPSSPHLPYYPFILLSSSPSSSSTILSLLPLLLVCHPHPLLIAPSPSLSSPILSHLPISSPHLLSSSFLPPPLPHPHLPSYLFSLFSSSVSPLHYHHHLLPPSLTQSVDNGDWSSSLGFRVQILTMFIVKSCYII